MRRVSLRSEGSAPLAVLPSLGGVGRALDQEAEALEQLSLKGRGAYFLESQRTVGNRVHF